MRDIHGYEWLLILVLFGLVLVVTVSAWADPHPHEPDQPLPETPIEINNESQAIANGGRGGEAFGGSGGAVTMTEVHPDKITIRRAPSLGIVGSPSTAEMMQCYGLGGSSKDGAATGLVCVLQRDLYASFRADKYASGGNPSRAAAAWCSRRLNRQDFDSRGQCVNEMDLIYMAMYAVEVDEPELVSRETLPAQGLARGGILLAQVDEEEFEQVKAELAQIKAVLASSTQQTRSTQREQQQQQQVIETRDSEYDEQKKRLLAIPRIKSRDDK